MRQRSHKPPETFQGQMPGHENEMSVSFVKISDEAMTHAHDILITARFVSLRDLPDTLWLYKADA